MEKLQKEFQTLMDTEQEYEKAQSADNPWIRLYLNMDAQSEINRDYVKTYIDKIVVVDRDHIRIVMKENNYYQKLPVKLRSLSEVACG